MHAKGCLLLALAVMASAAPPYPSPARERRSLKTLPFKIPIIGALVGGSTLGSSFGFGGGQSEPAIPDLGQYPLWKVHRYHGISLQPIPLPGDHVRPYPPTVAGEPPSIVNVPNHQHAPQVTLPSNEYGPPPQPSPPGPYPPQDPTGPYSPPSAPYPPQDPPGPYPPPSVPYPPQDPPGPYPPPSAPYPPVVQAPYHQAVPPSAPYTPATYSNAYSPSYAHSNAHATSHSSAHSTANSFTFGPSANAATSAASQAGSGASASSVANSGGYLSSYTLPPYLPPEMAQKLQQYISTPEGRSKADILLGLVSGAQNLKSSAASSLQSVMQRLFGGAGGSSNIALESGTYTNVAQNYPGQQGLLNKLRAVGTGVSGSPLPNLPEVPPLPSIPGLNKIPEAPGLPHINLPDISHLPAHAQTGQRYVSISLPQPAPAAGPYVPAAAPHAPAPRIPSTSYGTPTGPTFPYQPNSEGGDISTYFPKPQDGYGVPRDAVSAGSEDQEQFEPLEPQEQEQVIPLRTTKLHRVEERQAYEGEDLRAYLDPEHQGFRPMANQQTDNELMEETEN